MKEFMEQEDSFSDWKKLPETEKAACERESQAAERENTEFDFSERRIYRTEDYLRQIRRIPRLTAEEEKSLFLRLAEGEETARSKLIVSNLRLAAYFARKAANGDRYILDDMIQEGNLALIEAVDRFDASQGWKFSTYAVHRIKKAVFDEKTRQRRLIALPPGLLERIREVDKAEAELEMLYGRKPTEEQIAYRLKIPVEKVKEAQTQAAIEMLPLEAIPGEGVEEDGE